MPLHVERHDEDEAPTKSTEFDDSLKNRPKQRSRLKTSFAFAHPPPQAFHGKWRLKPTLFLQLQQLSDSGRPTALLDVLESTIFSRMMVPMAFRGANKVAPNDLMVVKSGSYAKIEEAEEGKNTAAESESFERRELVATLSHPLRLRKGQGSTTINFQNGTSWQITALSNGSYEFATNDDSHRREVRWVRRPRDSTRATLLQQERGKDGNRHFAFSVINFGTRRHAVIARMTRASIEVVDHFPIRIGDGGLSPPASAASDSSAYDSEGGSLNLGDPDMVTVCEELRNLILITGSWIALREQWTQS